ncbi:WD repeat-containing protein 61 [Coprinopsis cinerea okayama7|uniref:WD repeat-containing protein 61 n=1 Tax=Coprinopsis cinerea (strain Okayama-7 / 130 / ATCC MYA-4618 / FGSC 9003) TaxID=240176 RepID=A8P6H2_COPC7|nr:WD repeat-containing protein 61 [Coprinopsis cinerea okayama7\|eukprot:XP_001839156.2 WD repeat-containing protein 61 [Coprinopsis cinerea okayama7\
MSLAFLHAHDCSEPHSEAVWDVAWTSADTTVSISADGSAKQWASISGQPQSPNAQFPQPHTLALVSLSVSPDGTLALYNSIEGLTSLWDLESGQVVARHESYQRSTEDAEPAWSVSLNPNKETYACSGASGNVTIRSAKTDNFGERLTSFSSGRNKFGMACAHSPDGSRVALASETGQIFIFDLVSGSLSTTYTSHAMSVRSIAWSPDSSLLISASEDKRLVLHDVRASPGGIVASFTGHSSWVLSTDISPDSRLALSGSADKTIKVWDIAARTAVSTIQDTGEVWSVSWRPKPPAVGTVGAFVSGGEDGTVKWWRGAGAGSS